MNVETAQNVDLQGLSKFLRENPQFRLEAWVNRRVPMRAGEFYIKIERLHGLPGPTTSSDNLSLGLYMMSEAFRDFKVGYNLRRVFLPKMEDIPEIKELPKAAPQSEMYPNLAETLRQNPLIGLFACFTDRKIRTGLGTYYNAEDSSDVYPFPIFYVDANDFHPEILDRITIPKHNIETFFTGKEAEKMLRIRDQRLERAGRAKS